MTPSIPDDLRFAFRYVRRRPLFSVTVMATLAVAIAAATTAYGLATAVLWRELPFEDASRLVFVWESQERDGQTRPARVTGSRAAAWRDSSTALSSMASFGAAGFTVDDAAGARSIHGVRVAANYFQTLGIAAALGRTFDPRDEVPGSERVVILSHALWQERFGARPAAVGETLRLSGQPYTIIGVMPPVVFPAWPVNPASVTLDADSRQLWVPIARTPALAQGRAHVFGVVARLAPGFSAAQAQDELIRATSSAALDPHGAVVSPFREQFVGDARLPLLVLAAAALAVLLIACANLAALYVAAFEARRAEFAMRAAVGAGLLRLIRQLTVETLLVTACGAVAGMLLARGALTLLPRRLPGTIPFLTAPALDLQVAMFAAVLAIAASGMLAAWPTWRLIRESPAPRGVAPPARSVVYRVLVMGQIGVTVALAVSAALLTRSLSSVRQRDPGFSIDRTFVADLSVPASRPPSARALAITEREILSRVAAVPGVRAVAAAYDHPLESNWTEGFTLIGDVSTRDATHSGELRIVSPGYFDAMDVAVRDGRALAESDDLDRPGAVVVNEAFAREIGGRVLGRRIRSDTPRFQFPDAPQEFVVVGVVEDERSRGLEAPAGPAVYMTTRQFPQHSFALIARTAGDPLLVTADVRAAVRGHSTAIAFDNPASLESLLAGQLVTRDLTTDVVSSFALSALALAALGMYGLLTVAVSGRTREIGVRLALGATPAGVAGHVLRDCLVNTGVGLLIGVALALASGRMIHSMLVGVGPYDVWTMIAVAALLAALAVVAALAPARRAARVDAMLALRAE
jgi:predicted permease